MWLKKSRNKTDVQLSNYKRICTCWEQFLKLDQHLITLWSFHLWCSCLNVLKNWLKTKCLHRRKDIEVQNSGHKYKATAIIGAWENHKDFFWNCSEASQNGTFLDSSLLDAASSLEHISASSFQSLPLSTYSSHDPNCFVPLLH